LRFQKGRRRMDVSKWPLNKIVQLPDFCFGRKWFIGMISGKEGSGADFVVSDEKLPDRMVVWGFYCTGRQTAMTSWEITYRMGPVQVYDGDSCALLPRVFTGLGHPKFFNEIWSQNGEPMFVMGLRKFVEPNGKRLVMAITTNDGTGYREFSAGIVISTFPTEVPDWIVSGLAGLR